MKKNTSGPKVLFIDIETAPMLGYVWDLFDQNVALNQIYKDWFILSFCAKWEHSDKVIYHDQSKKKDIENDKELLEKLWVLLDEADIVVGQNVRRFDIKKINARFLMHGMKPPSSYRTIDTLSIAKKNFALTSNKLEYMSKKLNKKNKKLSHKKFPGFSMWSECLKGNKAAWREMREYNIVDVLSLQELYETLSPWDNTINHNVYHDEDHSVCQCGSTKFKKNGFKYTNAGKYQRYVCLDCGRESRSAQNLLGKEKRKGMLR